MRSTAAALVAVHRAMRAGNLTTGGGRHGLVDGHRPRKTCMSLHVGGGEAEIEEEVPKEVTAVVG